MFNLRRKLLAAAVLFAVTPVFTLAQTPKPAAPAAATAAAAPLDINTATRRPAQGLPRHRRCLLQAHHRRPPIHRQEPARHPRHSSSRRLRQDQGPDHRQPSQEAITNKSLSKRGLAAKMQPVFPMLLRAHSLTGAEMSLSLKTKQDFFASIVAASETPRRFHLILYGIDPVNTFGPFRRSAKFSYLSFVKGATAARDVSPMNLALQILAPNPVAKSSSMATTSLTRFKLRRRRERLLRRLFHTCHIRTLRPISQPRVEER